MGSRCLKFSFDNAEVAGRFIDGVLALENMNGITITMDDVASESVVFSAADSQKLKPKMPSLQEYMTWVLEPKPGEWRTHNEIYNYYAQHFGH